LGIGIYLKLVLLVIIVKRYVAGAITGLVVLVIGIVWQWPDGRVHLVACDVGQGDGMLIWRGSAQVVVDGGPDRKIIDCLSRFVPFWDRSIELMVLTHPEADHVTGLVAVLQRYAVGQLVVGNGTKETRIWGEFKQAVAENQVPVHKAVAGEVIRIKGMDFKVISTREISAPVNETSVVLRLVYGQFSALLTGDIGSETETLLVNSGQILRSNVLKVGHHGSKFSSAEAFLRAVKPAVALISVGQKNRYGHPTQEALERLRAVGARILRTDESGDIEVVSDGEKVWVK
jgi:competence protein ComEC